MPQTMFSVALIGPDGIGKTTIGRRLEQTFPRPLKYLYMGENIDASNIGLPTTRWWAARAKARERAEPAPAAGGGPPKPASRGGVRRLLRSARGLVQKVHGFTHRVLEEGYRQRVADRLCRDGNIVLFDRHFLLDYYHHLLGPEAAARRFELRLHGFILKRINREPDLVICLDAPGDVPYRRKGERTPESLEERRRQYLSLRGVVRNFVAVDADRSLELVSADVASQIERFHQDWVSRRA